MMEEFTAVTSILMTVGLIVGIIDRLALGKKLNGLQEKAIEYGYGEWIVTDKYGATEFKFINPNPEEESEKESS